MPDRALSKTELKAFWRRIAPFVREQRLLYAVGAVFVLLSLGTMVLYPQLIRTIIDQGVQAGSMDRVNNLVLIMAGVLAVQAVASFARVYILDVAAQRATTQLRRWLLGRLIAQEMAFFDESNSADLNSRLTTDINRMNYTLKEVGPETLYFGFLALIAGGLMVYTSPVLSGVVLLVGPLIWGTTTVLGRLMRNEAANVSNQSAAVNRASLESLRGVQTIRVYNQEDAEFERYAEETEGLNEVRRREARAIAQRDSFSDLFSEGAVLLAIWVGGGLILSGSLTAGSVVTFILYAAMVMRSLRNLTRIGTEILRAEGATQRIFALGERQTQIPVSGGRRPDRLEGRLSLEGVGFAYRSRPDHVALEGIALEIARGETIALVGASGSGKSSIAKLMARLYDPDEGRVLLDGNDLREIDPVWLREQITLVPAEAALFARSVLDNIRFGAPDATLEEVRAAARVSAADTFIEALPHGYDTDVGEAGQLFSSGQRQRIAIARAVLRNPTILILDEATAALDSEGEAIVKESLRKLPSHPTIVIVSHRLSAVVDVDRVIVVRQGRIHATGTHEELMASSEHYRELVTDQLVAG